MRVDKYLKVARLVKRRSVCKELAEKGRVYLNGKVAKPSSEVQVNDYILLDLSDRKLTVKVLSLKEYALKEQAESMFEVVEEEFK